MNYLTEDYYRTKINQPEKLYSGLDAYVSSITLKFKSGPGVIRSLLESADEIDKLADVWKKLTDRELQQRLAQYREVFRRRRKNHQQDLFAAAAAIREAARRTLGLNPYIVQLAGALAMYNGYVAEMATGEGKTLTAALTAVLHGWTGLPCHIITVNDYLASRDAKWLKSFYEYCGVTVGCVTASMETEQRRQNYKSDVTYTTSKEVVADFLRDRLAMGSLQRAQRRCLAGLLNDSDMFGRRLVMRGIYAAIIDEADSILIDEAVTPLIISRSHENLPFVSACKEADMVAASMEPGIDYSIDQKYKEIELTPQGRERIVFTSDVGIGRRTELVEQALTAREFFHRDNQYIVKDGKVVIVDELTGRLMPQRSWRAGLHQLVEAKEGLDITAPTETMARLSFQRFFRFFTKLSGMTGTASESSEELWQIYKLPVVSVPENKPCQRIVYPAKIFKHSELKWQAVLDEIIETHRQGRPVLVGTRSIIASQELSRRLDAAGLPHRLLNAVHHQEEAGIIAKAGESSAITIATNMAGRGTDIKLDKTSVKNGGLHVIATEGHESKRIDRQLFGRSARQGDPGSARSFISLEDDLIKRYLPAPVKRVSRKLKPQLLLFLAQKNSQRIAFHRRRTVLNTDTWLDDSLSFAASDVL